MTCQICHEFRNTISLIYTKRIHINLDTTVETIYGNQQGGRKDFIMD
ncbi:MAG: hypothetical protein HY934_08605 [Candidatus Firestonebacteria bacterium]|nr:hypothetical protein [Candidatus Firestonebacteria bacterium]